MSNVEEVKREWLLRKNGYFYRPHSAGYTALKDEAGRYSEAEARRHCGTAQGVDMVHESQVPDTFGIPDELQELGRELAALARKYQLRYLRGDFQVGFFSPSCWRQPVHFSWETGRHGDAEQQVVLHSEHRITVKCAP